MKPPSTLACVLIAAVAGFLFFNWYGMHRAKTGHEVGAAYASSYLQTELFHQLAYGGFQRRWVRKAWMNGFREHTYLFEVAADTPALRESIEKAASAVPIQETYFRTAGYLGPSTAPAWWDTARLDAAADSRYLLTGSTCWRFTWLDNKLYIVRCDV